MQQRRLTTGLVRLAMAASVVLPCLLFGLACWSNYRSSQSLTDERLIRSLDVEQEGAQKTFQLVDLALDATGDLIGAMSDADIRANDARLHAQIKKLVGKISAIQSIWIYDAQGGVLLSSWVDPPPDQNFADRDFFKAHAAGDNGAYYGRIYQSAYNAQPFFTVSRGLWRNGQFVGVIEASVLPSNFFSFFSSMASTPGLEFALVRNDGLMLARYPQAPVGAPERLDERSGFRQSIGQSPASAIYTATSPIDHVERRFAYRRLAGTPLYLITGIATSVVIGDWVWGMAAHLIYGIPVTLLLLLTLYLVLRRTQRLYAEIGRRAAAEEALRQSQKLEAIGQLTGGIAHDFNNLLTVILGNLEMAQRSLQSWTEGAQTKLASRLDNAMQAAQRAATLTKRLLAFARQQPLNPTALDVNRVLNGLSELLRRALGEDLSLEIVGGGGVWPVEADATELEAAILNLAVNARDAMREGGKLTIETSNSYLDDAYCRQHQEVSPGQYVQIAVSDTGAGMTKATIDRAFEPFFTTKQSGKGTGLGLSQVYGFVKQSGGHVKIYSEPGEGTTVKIYLPRLIKAPLPAQDPRPSPVRGNAGERILVVEDDADVRAYVVETLDTLGYDVLEAESGEQALGVIGGNNGIDLLLTDVVMPGMNGRKLAEQAQRLRPTLKVLYMTGYSRNAIVHQGRLDPGFDLLQKPITSEQLATAVRGVLDA